MAKQKHRGSVGDKPKNSNDINSDLTGNGTYKGSLPSIVGKNRILIRGKSDYVYVWPDQVESIKAKYGKDFVRDLGEVKTDPRPARRKSLISYLI